MPVPLDPDAYALAELTIGVLLRQFPLAIAMLTDWRKCAQKWHSDDSDLPASLARSGTAK